MLSNTRVLSATKVNEARFGYNSLYNIISQELAGMEDVDARDRHALEGHRSRIRGASRTFAQQQSDQLRQRDQQSVRDRRQGLSRSWTTSPGFSANIRCGSAANIATTSFRRLATNSRAGSFTSLAPSPAIAQHAQRRLLRRGLLLGKFSTSISPSRWRRAISGTHEWAGLFDDTWKVTPHLTHYARPSLGSGAAAAGRLRTR